MGLTRHQHTFIVSLFLLPILLAGQNNPDINHRLEFSIQDFSLGKNNDYDIVRLDNASMRCEVGAPVVPVKYITLAIPAGTRVSDVAVRSLNPIDLQGSYLLLPGQPARTLDNSEPFDFVEPDQRIYSSASLYPDEIAKIRGHENIAGQQLVCIAIYPLQYSPRKRSIVVHTSLDMRLTLEYDAGNGIQDKFYRFPDTQRRIIETTIKRMVENPAAVEVHPARCGPSHILPPGEYDHVIITADAYLTSFGDLLYWDYKKGLRDTIISTEWIYNHYGGPGDTTKIRQFVIDAFQNWGTMYFLLGGEQSIVPCASRDYYSESAPSDQYYSDFDDDWVHEVFVGRLAFDNVLQIERYLTKLFRYTKAPMLTDYPTEIVLCGMDLDAMTPSEDLMEIISSYVYPEFRQYKVYDSQASNHRQDFLNYLNAGCNLVNHCDHSNRNCMGVGWINHAWLLLNSDVDNLVNYQEPSIVYSVGCNTLEWDFEDCIGEHFVMYNDEKAGIAHVGNTRKGMYMPGIPTGYSLELDLWWWYGLFVEECEDLGQALMYSKHRYHEGDGRARQSEWNVNTLGEPAMPIWTSRPETMTVVHDSYVPAAQTEFLIEVTNSGGAPVESAYVCCWIPVQAGPDEVYARAYTDNSGQTSVEVTPTTAGDTMYVTVTKHNFLPAESYALVIEAGSEEYEEQSVFQTKLLSLYPNPSSRVITLHYQTDKDVLVSLRIFDIAGRLIKSIQRSPANTPMLATISWDGTDMCDTPVAAGVYFIEFTAGRFRATEKVLLTR